MIWNLDIYTWTPLVGILDFRGSAALQTVRRCRRWARVPFAARLVLLHFFGSEIIQQFTGNHKKETKLHPNNNSKYAIQTLLFILDYMLIIVCWVLFHSNSKTTNFLLLSQVVKNSCEKKILAPPPKKKNIIYIYICLEH